MKRRIRVLIAKPGLDGHEVGARLIARALSDAGMEVIYLGPRQTPEAIVNAALQEAVDVIGLSILSGVHKDAVHSVMNTLKENGAEDITLIVGGIIPRRDIHDLMVMGAKGVFGPGTSTEEVIRFIEEISESALND